MTDLKELRRKFNNHETILPEELSDLLDQAERYEKSVIRVRSLNAVLSWAPNMAHIVQRYHIALEGNDND